MSNGSIPRTRKNRNWRKHLSRQRRIARYDASIEVVQIEARMQVRLSPQAWDEIEARWQALPDPNACMPEQRRDYMLHEEAAMEEARENGRQEMLLRLIDEVDLSDAGARRHIALVEQQVEVLRCSPTA